MNKGHLEDFINITEGIKEKEGIIVPVGDLVSEYTRIAILESKDGFKPSDNNYYHAYLKVMKQYIIEKVYKNEWYKSHLRNTTKTY